MNEAAIAIGRSYAYREKRAADAPILRVTVLAKVGRRGKLRVRFEDGPHPGLEEYFSSRQTVREAGWQHIASERAASAAAPDRPTEFLDRYPRYINRLQQFTGRTEPEEACAVIDDLLSPGILAQLTCPFHVVHGTSDRVFMIDGARRLYQWVATEQKTFMEFAEGDHCISNRADEKDALIADWFVDHLG